MKPGRKISLTYSIVTILLVVGASAVFYFGSRHYITSLYYRYLEEKARVLAMQRYGQDDLDPAKYQHAVHAAADAIPTSEELFVPEDSIGLAMASLLDSAQMASLRRGDVVNFKRGGDVGTALLYYDNSGTYASVVLSRNPYGDEMARTMRAVLVCFILGTSLLLWLVSRLWASRMVNRIDQNYHTERLFVNNAQHEINNPLTAIRGECEVTLMRERSPEEYRAALERVGRQADRIDHIMSQLLALSNARNGWTHSSQMQVGQWLRTAGLPPMQLRVVADFTVTADPEALLIAMSNLVGNAVKYGTGEAALVTVDRPVVTVSNQGRPIPEAELKHIFEPFYRASNAEGVGGHGIGLSLAHALLERNGARLSVESTAEAGTVFTVRF